MQLRTSFKRLARFLVSGVLAALTEYSSFLVLTSYFDSEILSAHVISFFLGMIVSFLLNQYWVFQKSKDGIVRNNVKYFIVALCNLLLSALLLSLITAAGVAPMVAKLLVMVCIAACNYVVYAKFVFR